MSFRICVINQKGGSGKSSLCFHLSGQFARMGLRVLLVDCDPQASLSQGLLGPDLVQALEVGDTLAALFDEATAMAARGPIPMLTPVDGVSLIPANSELAPHNDPRPEVSGLLQQSLRAFIDDLEGFDIVLFDCPPNLYQCTWNALVASDFVVVPVPPEDFATQGLAAVHQAVLSARRLNPGLRLLGHVVTRCDRRLLIHQAYEESLREAYPGAVLSTVIPEAAAFKVAVSSRQPVCHSLDRSKAAQSIALLAGELLESCGPTQQLQRTVA